MDRDLPQNDSRAKFGIVRQRDQHALAFNAIIIFVCDLA